MSKVQLILHDPQSDLFNLDFLQKVGIKNSGDKKVVIIAPGPEMADELRSVIRTDLLASDGLRVDVITYAGLLREELRNQFGKEKRILKKSELLYHFAPIWKDQHRDSPSFEKFLQAYKLFSDLRSYTLDFNLLAEMESEFDQEVFLGVRKFWFYLNHLSLIDEQGVLPLLADTFEDKFFIFWGFKFFSGVQVDFLKNMALKNLIMIPYAKDLYERRQHYDWVSWIDSELIDITNSLSQPCPRKNSISFFKEKSMHIEFRKLMNSIGSTPFEVAWAKMDEVNAMDFAQLPFSSMAFKFSLDMYSACYRKLFISLKEKFFLENNRNNIATIEINNFLQQKLLLLQEKNAHDFLQQKVILHCLQEMMSYSELSEINKFLTLFDLRLIFYIMELDSARISAVDLFPDEKLLKIKNANSLFDFSEEKENKELFLIVDKSCRIGDSGADNFYTSKVISFFSAISPFRRSDYMEELFEVKLDEIMAKRNVHFLVDEKLVKSSSFWKKRLRELKKIEIRNDIDNVPCVRNIKDGVERDNDVSHPVALVKTDHLHLSATSLQNFIDCPRKYYYLNILRLRARANLQDALSYAELGELEHFIIAQYITSENKGKILNTVEYEEFVNRELTLYLQKKDKRLSPFNFLRSLKELTQYTRNGIEFLLRVEKNKNVLWKYTFEKELKLGTSREYDIRGKIDLVMESDDEVMVFDFKRSKNSFGSKSDFIGFVDIQLWFYLYHLHEEKTISLLGKLPLKEMNDSWLYGQDGQKELAESLGIKIDVCDFKNKLLEYAPYEDKVVKEILQARDRNQYKIRPRSLNVCHFCPMNLTCPKGDINDEENA